ncbi:MAG: hypothetical protein HUJ26_19520, partial [Planctomycetaceae bacterium]|nr:hypothetical protein [Planctomycetaceae bacterium]
MSTETTLEDRIAEIYLYLGEHFADLKPDEVAELRVLGERSAMSGFYDDLEEMAQQAAVLDDEGWAVYYGLNPRRKNITDSPNEIGSRVGGKDKDVTRRAWLFLDFDPDKTPEGKGQCATKQEKDAARSRVKTVAKWLAAKGFGSPKIVDSGNGYHVLYKVDLPTDTDLCEGVLRAAKAEFGIEMDSVFDAARIARLPGGLNRKGNNTAERPHRRAKLLGGKPKTVPPATLRKVALGHAAQPATRREPAKTGKLPISETRWAAANSWLAKQPAAIEGDGGDKQTFTVCCFLARDFALEWDDAWELLLEYNERCNPPWD